MANKYYKVEFFMDNHKTCDYSTRLTDSQLEKNTQNNKWFAGMCNRHHCTSANVIEVSKDEWLNNCPGELSQTRKSVYKFSL